MGNTEVETRFLDMGDAANLSFEQNSSWSPDNYIYGLQIGQGATVAGILKAARRSVNPKDTGSYITSESLSCNFNIYRVVTFACLVTVNRINHFSPAP